MRCRDCDKYIPVNEMPENGKTIARCTSCGKRILYASDNNMGGGA